MTLNLNMRALNLDVCLEQRIGLIRIARDDVTSLHLTCAHLNTLHLSNIRRWMETFGCTLPQV